MTKPTPDNVAITFIGIDNYSDRVVVGIDPYSAAAAAAISALLGPESVVISQTAGSIRGGRSCSLPPDPEHGGTHGLRDEHLLESALARPRQRWHHQDEASLAELAAACGFGLVDLGAGRVPSRASRG